MSMMKSTSSSYEDCVDAYRFPPPRKLDAAFALVVEKKGDESRNSMKQNEIYCFSPDIKMDSGVMLMPKDTWKQYKIGDWIHCHKVFADRQDKNQYQERELINIKRVDLNLQKQFELPVVEVFGENVNIRSPFVVCPKFFRHRTSTIGGGHLRKLILLNLGQAFMNVRRYPEFEALREGVVYSGLFQFRSKNNGGVNFAFRETVDGHPLEIDALWELEMLGDLIHPSQTDHGIAVKTMRIMDHLKMKKYLESVMGWAVEYGEKYALDAPCNLKAKNNNSNTMVPKVANDSRTTNAGTTAVKSRPIVLPPKSQSRSSRILPSNRRSTDGPNLNDATIVPGSPDQGYLTQSFSNMVFDQIKNRPRNREREEDALRRRDQVITATRFLHRDRMVSGFIDRETNEKSTNKDELYRKYEIRHSCSQENYILSESEYRLDQLRQNVRNAIPSASADSTFNFSNFYVGINSASTPMVRSPAHSPVRGRRRNIDNNINIDSILQYD